MPPTVIIGGNHLRKALAERGWSYRRTILELRKVAALAGRKLPGDASMLTQLSRWVNNHQQPDKHRWRSCALWSFARGTEPASPVPY